MKYQFYTETDKRVLDEQGSSITVIRKVHAGMDKSIKRRYEVRVRVSDSKQELEEFLRFRAETEDKLDQSFNIEDYGLRKEKGHYYIIKCWTESGGQS